jgi:hypothetical protein
MTDKEWDLAISEIQSLRYQLTHNIMSPAERHDMKCKIVLRLHALSEAERMKGDRK